MYYIFIDYEIFNYIIFDLVFFFMYKFEFSILALNIIKLYSFYSDLKISEICGHNYFKK